MNKLISCVALSTLLAGTAAIAADQMEKPANSGPGVQGAPDTRTGPSTKGTDDPSSTGASSGDAGADTGKQTGPGAAGDAGSK